MTKQMTTEAKTGELQSKELTTAIEAAQAAETKMLGSGASMQAAMIEYGQNCVRFGELLETLYELWGRMGRVLANGKTESWSDALKGKNSPKLFKSISTSQHAARYREIARKDTATLADVLKLAGMKNVRLSIAEMTKIDTFEDGQKLIEKKQEDKAKREEAAETRKADIEKERKRIKRERRVNDPDKIEAIRLAQVAADKLVEQQEKAAKLAEEAGIATELGFTHTPAPKVEACDYDSVRIKAAVQKMNDPKVLEGIRSAVTLRLDALAKLAPKETPKAEAA